MGGVQIFERTSLPVPAVSLGCPALWSAAARGASRGGLNHGEGQLRGFSYLPSRRQGVSEAKKKVLIPLSRLRGVVTRPEGLHPSHHQRPVAAGLTPTPRRRNQTRHCWWWCVPACRVHPEHESGCEDEDPENQGRYGTRAIFWSLHFICSNTNQRDGDKREQVSRDKMLSCQILRKRHNTCGVVEEWEKQSRFETAATAADNILVPSSPRSDCRHSIPFSSLAGRGLGHDIISPRLIRSAPNSARFPPLDPDSPQRQHGLPMRSSREITNGNRESPFPDPAGHRGARQLHPSTHLTRQREPPLPKPA